MIKMLLWSIFVSNAVIVFVLYKEVIRKLSQLDDKIAELTTEVANDSTVIASAVTLINGFAAQLAAAIAAALAAGATATQLQSLTDLKTTLLANDDALAAAVAANTPPIP